MYLDPPYYKTFDKYNTEGFNYDMFIRYLENVTNKDNYRIILSNSIDFQEMLSKNDKINLSSICNVSLLNFTNTTKPAKERIELLATNVNKFLR